MHFFFDFRERPRGEKSRGEFNNAMCSSGARSTGSKLYKMYTLPGIGECRILTLSFVGRRPATSEESSSIERYSRKSCAADLQSKQPIIETDEAKMVQYHDGPLLLNQNGPLPAEHKRLIYDHNVLY